MLHFAMARKSGFGAGYHPARGLLATEIRGKSLSTAETQRAPRKAFFVFNPTSRQQKTGVSPAWAMPTFQRFPEKMSEDPVL
jgi:hypothetical protein